jgi:hypothetical protein
MQTSAPLFSVRPLISSAGLPFVKSMTWAAPSSLEDGHRQDGDHKAWDPVQDLDYAHHEVVHPASQEPRDRPVGDAYEHVQASSQETDVERDPSARPHPSPHVPAELVGAKPEL